MMFLDETCTQNLKRVLKNVLDLESTISDKLLQCDINIINRQALSIAAIPKGGY